MSQGLSQARDRAEACDFLERPKPIFWRRAQARGGPEPEFLGRAWKSEHLIVEFQGLSRPGAWYLLMEVLKPGLGPDPTFQGSTYHHI